MSDLRKFINVMCEAEQAMTPDMNQASTWNEQFSRFMDMMYRNMPSGLGFIQDINSVVSSVTQSPETASATGVELIDEYDVLISVHPANEENIQTMTVDFWVDGGIFPGGQSNIRVPVTAEGASQAMAAIDSAVHGE